MNDRRCGVHILLIFSLSSFHSQLPSLPLSLNENWVRFVICTKRNSFYEPPPIHSFRIKVWAKGFCVLCRKAAHECKKTNGQQCQQQQQSPKKNGTRINEMIDAVWIWHALGSASRIWFVRFYAENTSESSRPVWLKYLCATLLNLGVCCASKYMSHPRPL